MSDPTQEHDSDAVSSPPPEQAPETKVDPNLLASLMAEIHREQVESFDFLEPERALDEPVVPQAEVTEAPPSQAGTPAQAQDQDAVAATREIAAPSAGSESSPTVQETTAPTSLSAQSITAESPHVEDPLVPLPQSHDVERVLADSTQETPASNPPTPESSEQSPEEVPKTNTRRRWPIMVSALGLLAVGGLLGYYYSRASAPQSPPSAATTPLEEQPLEQVVAHARKLLDQGLYDLAESELQRAVEKAPQGSVRTDAEFLLLEIRYKKLAYVPGSPAVEAMYKAISDLVEAYPGHPSVPLALQWKAHLYLWDDLPLEAKEIYDQLIRYYGNAPNRESVLYEAARLAFDLRDYKNVSSYVQMLASEFPSSPYLAEARLVLADAFRESGLGEDARTFYVRIIQGHPNTPSATQAYLRLAEMALAEENAPEAVRLLEGYLSQTLSTEFGDQVYLLLGRAYLESHDYARAQQTLEDMIHFFADSPKLPEVWVLLSRAHEGRGDRSKALETARRATSLFPKDTRVLTNFAELCGLNGDALQAAEAYREADRAGIDDPEVLLRAAEMYRTAGAEEEALAVLTELRERYPLTSAALQGGLEQARLLYSQGRILQALAQLEELAAFAVSKPQESEVLEMQARLYAELGLGEPLARITQRITEISRTPSMLATLASALLQAGRWQDARAVLEQVPMDTLSPAEAYGLQKQLAHALLQMDPKRGLDRLEQISLQYAPYRTLEDDITLLEAFVRGRRQSSADRTFLEMQQAFEQQPRNHEDVFRAGVTYADDLYASQRYGEAAQVYRWLLSLPERSDYVPSDRGIDTDWAKWRCALAEYKQGNLQEAYKHLMTLAKSNSPYRTEAETQARTVATELRLRGLEVPATNSDTEQG